MMGFFRKKIPITVTIKLYSGIHCDLNLDSYDLGKGIIIQTLDGVRIRTIFNEIGMLNQSTCAYYINGKRVSLGTRLRDGDEVSCFKPSAGG
jgi:molybdopterin converting factor small subunit